MEISKFSEANTQNLNNDSYSGIQELSDGEVGLARYNLYVAKKIFEAISARNFSNSLRILEFGAGTGVLADIFKNKFKVTPICVEIDPRLISILKSKGFVAHSSLDNIKSKQFAIYTSNVLEHIEDDIEALLKIRNKLEVNGILAIYVPALPFLYSDLDRQVGHYRRYKRSELINKVKIAGFEVEECFFSDSIGVLASLAVKCVGFKNSANLGSLNSLLFYDRFIFPISKFLDKIFFKRFIGKNIYLFAVNK